MVPCDWQLCRIDTIATISAGGTPNRKDPSYWDGNIPWVTTAEVNFSRIKSTNESITPAGLANSSAKLLSKDTILLAMYGQGKTRGQVGILDIEAATNQACAAIRLKSKHSAEYFFQYLQSKYADIRNLSNSGGQDNLSGAIVKSIEVAVPPFEEQSRIADILSTWDQAIETTEKLIENSKAQKKALMQQLLTGKKRLPSLVATNNTRATRYGDLPRDWSFVRIGEIAAERTERAGENTDIPVLSCSKYDGFVDSLRYFKKKVYSDDTSNYKVVRRGEYGFPSNHIEEGSIGYQDICEVGIVSPIYSVFKTSDDVHDGYLYRLLKTEHYRQIFQASTNASVDRRGSLRWKEFSKIRVPLPPLAEQQKISEIVDAADADLASFQNQLLWLDAEKRALMQQLLTGKRRVKIAA